MGLSHLPVDEVTVVIMTILLVAILVVLVRNSRRAPQPTRVEYIASEEFKHQMREMGEMIAQHAEISTIIGVIKAMRDNAADLRQSNVELLQHAHLSVQATFFTCLATTSEAAQKVAKHLRDAEDYLGRYGGTETKVNKLRTQRDRLAEEVVRIQNAYSAYLNEYGRTHSESTPSALS